MSLQSSQLSTRGFIAAALIVLTGHGMADTQTFQFSPQWNLISFQVIPDEPDPGAVFATIPGFQSAWSYDSANALWQRYAKPTGTATEQTDAHTANRLLELPPIEPGRGYWVQVEAATSWSVTGTVPRGIAFPSLNLDAGWQLIGIPVGAASVTNTEPVSLLAVLTAAGFDYDAMLTWSNSYRKMFRPQGDTNHPFAGLPPDLPFPEFSLQTDLGRGYWVRVIDPAVLRPRLVTTVRPDIDVEPRGNFPSKEDLNVSGAADLAEFKSVQDQEVIRFFPGEDVQTVGIANLGEGHQASGGILLWEAVWSPLTDTTTPEPWIRLFTSRDQREQRDHAGRLVAGYTNLTGVTTIENDLVYLRLDRKNLGRGVHEGTLLLRTTVGDRAFHVIAEVPGLEGDFAGYAVIHTVNGKANPVPDIDLSLTFYEDLKVDGLLRGVIDSSRAVLWPVDVPLIGHRVADEGNRFVLGGSFVMPPGDQNGEPYDQWDENDPAAGEDVDWLNDGQLDIRNPFPFPIQRSVLLEGELVQANPTDGYVVKGTYRETVYGMSRKPIHLLGTFHLDRRAIRPFTQRRSVDRDTGVEPVVMTNNTQVIAIASGATRTNTLDIATELELQAFETELVFEPLAHSHLVVRLRSPGPDGAELLLYDGSNPATALSARALDTVTFPTLRPPTGDLNLFLEQIPRTRSSPNLGRRWELVIENRGAQTVTLQKWSLRLEGQPVTDVHGLVRDGNLPLSGVTVALDGLPISLYSAASAADGRFALSRVPLLPLNFSASVPGYLPENPAQPGLAGTFITAFGDQPGLLFTAREQELMRRFNPMAGAPPAPAGIPGFNSGNTHQPFELQLRPDPNLSGNPIIVAGPLQALAGSSITFVALNPAGAVLWDFGDGTTNDSPVVNHTFAAPGLYRVKLFSPADAVTPQDTVTIVMLAAPGNAPIRPADLAGELPPLDPVTTNAIYGAHVFQTCRFSGGVLTAGIAPQATFASGETNLFGAALVSRLPLQHAYTASMDMDLAPHLNPSGTSQAFTNDGFTPLISPGFDPGINVNNLGFQEEDFNYSLPEDLWRNTSNSVGQLEYTQDAVNGLIVWGNSLVTPNLNYATGEFTARDGASFNVSQDDPTYHPHPGTSTFADLAPNSVVTHYRVACRIGAEMLTASVPTTSVKLAKPSRSQLDNALEPELLPAPGPVSRNLYYQLHTGP